MVDLAEVCRQPVEVYQAAIGNTGPLAERLRSGANLNRIERNALACLVEGKLVPLKLNPGQRRPRYLWNIWELFVANKLPEAGADYHHIMGELRKIGEHYGRSEEVIDYVAKKWEIDARSVKHYVRRSKSEKSKPNGREPEGAVQGFHRWLAKQDLI